LTELSPRWIDSFAPSIERSLAWIRAFHS
jgi:hypothetical protein